MRILMIGWSGGEKSSGGMDVHIRELCRNLASEDHSVDIVLPEAARGAIAEDAVTVHYVPCRINCTSIGETVKSVRQYNRNIIARFKKSTGFEIIHSHDWLGVGAAKTLSKAYGKPWVHTVHSLEHIRAAEKTKSPICRIENRGIIESSQVITVSSLMKKEILAHYKVSPEKISVIYNYAGLGVPPAEIKAQGSHNVLYAGRLALQKGVEYLILAFEKVLKVFPSARLVIAGDGNLNEGLHSLALSLGIEKSVDFRGFVTESELRDLYENAALFVSPSVFEPFGITVLDAVAFGIPVMATKNTGCLELFSKESIAVAEPENSGAIAAEIIRLLKDDSARRKMAGCAKSDLKKADDWECIAKKTSGVYASLC